MRTVRGSITRFGLLYSFIVLPLVIPSVMVFGWQWGLYPHSVGLKVRIAPELLFGTENAPVIVTVRCAKERAPDGSQLEFRLNSRPISAEGLRAGLREELSRQARQVVYVDADACTTAGDVVAVVDIARDAWYAVPVILLTPKTKKMLDVERGVH